MFLGFVNFYKRFIQGYSSVAKPFTDLTKKEQEFEWTSVMVEVFTELKNKFTTASILVTFDL